MTTTFAARVSRQTAIVAAIAEFEPPGVALANGDARVPEAGGGVTARILIDAGGNATAWNVVQSSGFPRLEFAAGRRDGRAVARCLQSKRPTAKVALAGNGARK